LISIFKVEEVRDALTRIGIQGMAVTGVAVFGREKITRKCIAEPRSGPGEFL
jgi:nitrogen regulatory protein PII